MCVICNSFGFNEQIGENSKKYRAKLTKIHYKTTDLFYFSLSHFSTKLNSFVSCMRQWLMRQVI